MTTAALEKRQIELDERDRLLKEKGSAAEKTPKPAEVARMKSAAATVKRLVPRQGELLAIAESRTILMLYFGLVKDGSSPNQAAMSTLLAMLRFNEKMIIFFFVVKSTLEGATTNIIPSAIWFGNNIDCLCLGRCALTVLYREVSFFFELLVHLTIAHLSNTKRIFVNVFVFKTAWLLPIVCTIICGVHPGIEHATAILRRHTAPHNFQKQISTEPGVAAYGITQQPFIYFSFCFFTHGHLVSGINLRHWVWNSSPNR